MDTLNRIENTFNSIRYAVRNKKSSERIQCLKKEIHSLSTDLVVFGKESHEQYIRSLAMEGYIALLTAKTISISLAEKVNILQSTFEKLKKFALREECLFIFLRVQNLLCFYLIQTDKEARAVEILESMETLYDGISKSQSDKFLDAEDLFAAQPINNIKKIKPEKIDKVITNNLQMQAFLYNKLNLHDKYTLYNHTVLRRQLEMKEGTPQDWALRAASLGNYFTYLNDLPNARHHLCAAYHVLRNCQDNCKVLPQEIVLQKTDFEMHFLELGHHWIKYGLTLFKLSKKKILNKYFSPPLSKPDLWKALDVLDENLSNAEVSEEENIKDHGAEKCNTLDSSTPQEQFRFPSLNLKEMENGVPVNTVSTEEEARKLFSFSHKWLMRTKHYYDFERHSAQYISCTLQLAELYEHLAFFEKNIDNQYSIQKRRADVLEILNSLLKTCGNVMSVQIDVIRELSQVQLELMALNLQKLWREESNTNLFNIDSDADSIINSLDSESKKTLTGRHRGSSCKDLFLRKMEAATSINGKLFRLNSQLVARTPSQVSLPTTCTKL